MKWALISLLMLAFFAKAEPNYYCTKGEASFRAVDLETLLGPVRIALFDAYAPHTTDNFVYYVQQGFYDNTIVHQVQRRFYVVAGLYGNDQKPKAPLRPPIASESDNKIEHQAMRVAMWRDNDPNSATSAFFINLADNATLNIPHGYTVFGEVIMGKDRVKRMQYQFLCQQIDKADSDCRPIVIRSAKLVDIPCETAS